MKKILAIMSLAVALVSCNKGDNSSENKSEVTFKNGVITKATGTTWAAGDKIGVYMFESEGGKVAEENGNIAYYNSNATAGSKANFKSVATTPMYFPLYGALVDFVAYYPYNEYAVGLSDFIYEVDVNTPNQEAQENIDLMISDNLKSVAATKDALALNFTHALSQLNFTLKTGVGSPSLEGVKIEVAGLINDCTVDLVSREITLGAAASDLTVTDKSAIVIPQSAELTFTIITNDAPSGFTTEPQIFNFVAGEAINVTLNVNKTSVEFADDTVGGEIVDWVENSVSVDAE